jgi:hypothetical protein
VLFEKRLMGWMLDKRQMFLAFVFYMFLICCDGMFVLC